MYEYGRYWRVILVALVLTLAYVLFHHRAHGVDKSQRNRDQSTVNETQCKKVGIQIEVDRVAETGNKLDQYASKAYPAWAREHRDREWPDTVDDLNKYIGACDSLDSWGHQIKLLCGPKVPGGGCTLVSAGADGKFDTGDDQSPF